jgi:hypothetical protein
MLIEIMEECIYAKGDFIYKQGQQDNLGKAQTKIIPQTEFFIINIIYSN